MILASGEWSELHDPSPLRCQFFGGFAVKGKNDGETLSFFTTPLTARNMVIFYPDPLFFAFFPIFSYFFLIFKSPPPL